MPIQIELSSVSTMPNPASVGLAGLNRNESYYVFTFVAVGDGRSPQLLRGPDDNGSPTFKVTVPQQNGLEVALHEARGYISQYLDELAAAAKTKN